MTPFGPLAFEASRATLENPCVTGGMKLKRITAGFAITYVCVLAAVIVIAPFGYPGYNSPSQHISELGAYGAPNAVIVNVALSAAAYC
ncbi:hypothetical protein [Brevundimonas phoenicis]|uniref:hypothetical protein n=1 Tax=unclassified Brevundimonas TaxID=2622653 RepID=UPI0039A2A7D2